MTPALRGRLFLLPACGVLQARSRPTLIIRDVKVMDTAGGPAQPHRTVIVRDGKTVKASDS
jgi:hypothetical protein